MANRFLPQKTLRNSIHCSGIGLHTGAKVNMTLHPAAAETGIVFHRNDVAGGARIEASWENAVEAPLCTTLVGDGGAKLCSIEHLMSALAGCGIDNLVVELNGPEVPVMDGSAAPFVFLIECAGTVEQDAPRRALRIRKEVTVADPCRSASIAPGAGLSIDFEIEFDNPVVARQRWSIQVSDATYKRDVSRARTFGFLEEVDNMRAKGLARGGSLDNAVVISGRRILNDGGLRYDNEFVRHKVLDLIGDLYLAGAPVIGRVRGYRAGHALSLRMLKALFADHSAWTWTEMTETDLAQPVGATVPPVRAVAARA
ncbi:MAG: UDP-3-O-acyl-N-acetylglucosamine deacetylase [Kiloniellaceae bacterium]